MYQPILAIHSDENVLGDQRFIIYRQPPAKGLHRTTAERYGAISVESTDHHVWNPGI